MGYHRAGFEVVGVDNRPMPNYPFEFHQADALEFVIEHGKEFDAIHASPPCQAYSTLSALSPHKSYPDLVETTRLILSNTSKLSVIENVMTAPIRRDIRLCGEMFGLSVIRHRKFELDGWKCRQPYHKPHRGKVRGWNHGVWQEGPYLSVHGFGSAGDCTSDWKRAMGIDWTNVRKEIAEAIPPAYTEYIGKELGDGILSLHRR